MQSSDPSNSSKSGDRLRPAVFFDRDGVLNVDRGFVHKPADFEWMPGAPNLIKAVNGRGWLAFVVSNQSGIARGMFEEQAVRDLHAWMNRDLARFGAHIDDFAFCPHHPEGTRPEYAVVCRCRKPAPGMFETLMARWPVDAARSITIGDRDRDLAAGAAVGVKGLLFSGGNLFEFAQANGLI
ncbi:MAG: HAD family hydrolase [Rhodobacteraceae bacterium]|nr:HAD family hydrolase [Paracoccaceae bacterium]